MASDRANPQLSQAPHQMPVLAALGFVALLTLSLAVVLVTRGCHNNEVRDVNVPITITLGK